MKIYAESKNDCTSHLLYHGNRVIVNLCSVLAIDPGTESNIIIRGLPSGMYFTRQASDDSYLIISLGKPRPIRSSSRLGRVT